MTPRPPMPPSDALSADERELALRLAKLDASVGPSAALDARILGAARAAAVRAPLPRTRRWPGAVGAAAVLVAAVGLAWQLRPMFELPPPSIHAESAGDAGNAGARSETVVQIESVRHAPSPVAATGNEAAARAPAAADRKAAPAAGGIRPATPASPAAAHAARRHPPEFVDEAMPAGEAPVPAPPPPPPPPPAAPSRGDALPTAPSPQLKAAAPAARVARAALPPDVSADTRLSARAWLARIRERREAGDLDGARASLQRFVVAHRYVRVPADLRPLLRDDDPWSP